MLVFSDSIKVLLLLSLLLCVLVLLYKSSYLTSAWNVILLCVLLMDFTLAVFRLLSSLCDSLYGVGVGF